MRGIVTLHFEFKIQYAAFNFNGDFAVLKKWIFLIFSLVSINGWSQPLSPQDELTQVNAQINELEEHLHQEHLEEMREIVESQEYFIADWKRYSQEVQDIRREQADDRLLVEKIQKLKQRKAQLIQQLQADKG